MPKADHSLTIRRVSPAPLYAVLLRNGAFISRKPRSRCCPGAQRSCCGYLENRFCQRQHQQTEPLEDQQRQQGCPVVATDHHRCSYQQTASNTRDTVCQTAEVSDVKSSSNSHNRLTLERIQTWALVSYFSLSTSFLAPPCLRDFSVHYCITSRTYVG